MTSPSDIRNYIVGIEFDRIDGEMGFFDIKRKVTLDKLAEEVLEYLANGKSSFPAFPPDANPAILYAWNLDNPNDGDIYHDLAVEMKKLTSQKAA